MGFRDGKIVEMLAYDDFIIGLKEALAAVERQECRSVAFEIDARGRKSFTIDGIYQYYQCAAL